MLVIWRYIGALEISGGGGFVGRFAAAVTVVHQASANDHKADDDDNDCVANYVARNRGELETAEMSIVSKESCIKIGGERRLTWRR